MQVTLDHGKLRLRDILNLLGICEHKGALSGFGR